MKKRNIIGLAAVFAAGFLTADWKNPHEPEGDMVIPLRNLLPGRVHYLRVGWNYELQELRALPLGAGPKPVPPPDMRPPSDQ